MIYDGDLVWQWHLPATWAAITWDSNSWDTEADEYLKFIMFRGDEAVEIG